MTIERSVGFCHYSFFVVYIRGDDHFLVPGLSIESKLRSKKEAAADFFRLDIKIKMNVLPDR